MRKDLLTIIRCPVCGGVDFTVSATQEDAREIRQGDLTCTGCERCYAIDKGIVDLMPDPDPVITSEIEGWSVLLGETTDELVQTMLELPYLEDGTWITTYVNWDQIMADMDLRGKSVLDIGAGRCWSTRRMIQAGATYAVALDILLQRYIGLETADIFLEHDGIYFERIVGDMNDLPFQPAMFDVVFMTGTLHHSSHPDKALAEIAKVLKPGGTALIINEPVISIFRDKDFSGCVEVEHGINENVYTLGEYMQATHGAGLRSHLLLPASITQGFESRPEVVEMEVGRFGYAVMSRLWKTGWGRRAMAGPLLRPLYRIASMPLVMKAVKA